jgi:hypothetical protein
MALKPDHVNEPTRVLVPWAVGWVGAQMGKILGVTNLRAAAARKLLHGMAPSTSGRYRLDCLRDLKPVASFRWVAQGTAQQAEVFPQTRCQDPDFHCQRPEDCL